MKSMRSDGVRDGGGGGVCLRGGAGNRAGTGEVSDQAGAHRRGVFGRQRDRHHRAHDRAEAFRHLEAARHHREPLGRGRRDGDHRGRESHAGRAHAGAHFRLVRDHRGPEQGSSVRPGEGFRGRDPDRYVQRRARGDAVAGRQDRQGPDRAGEGAARQARIRLGGRRQRHTHDRRALQDGGRHQYRARGLQGAAGDAYRASFRPHRLRLSRPRHVSPFHQGREAPGAGGRHQKSHAAASRIFRP